MKSGIAVIAYARPDYLRQCLESLKNSNWGGADVRVVCIDFKDTETSLKLQAICEEYGILHLALLSNGGVAKNKNQGLKYLLANDCDHLFLMEDDILMKDPNTCIKYIKYAAMHRLEHLNFAHHGPANVGKQKLYDTPRGPLAVYPNCVGAFSYYTRNCIETVGLIDEGFRNVWEHVEHTYRIIKEGMYTQFWYFADYPASKKLLEEIPGSIENSTIRYEPNWQNNMDEGRIYWIAKHGQFLPEFPIHDWN